MECRTAKINFSAAGGTAAEGSRTCKLTLPGSWLARLGISENRKEVELVFDGENIRVIPFLDFDSFFAEKKQRGHNLKTLRLYDRARLCSTIVADYDDCTLRVRNEDVELIKTAFGNNRLPSWEDYEYFLKERCIPRERSGLRAYMDVLGIDAYDPLEIIRKTHGRMAEDEQWLEVEDFG